MKRMQKILAVLFSMNVLLSFAPLGAMKKTITQAWPFVNKKVLALHAAGSISMYSFWRQKNCPRLAVVHGLLQGGIGLAILFGEACKKQEIADAIPQAPVPLDRFSKKVGEKIERFIKKAQERSQQEYALLPELWLRGNDRPQKTEIVKGIAAALHAPYVESSNKAKEFAERGYKGPIVYLHRLGAGLQPSRVFLSDFDEKLRKEGVHLIVCVDSPDKFSAEDHEKDNYISCARSDDVSGKQLIPQASLKHLAAQGEHIGRRFETFVSAVQKAQSAKNGPLPGLYLVGNDHHNKKAFVEAVAGALQVPLYTTVEDIEHAAVSHDHLTLMLFVPRKDDREFLMAMKQRVMQWYKKDIAVILCIDDDRTISELPSERINDLKAGLSMTVVSCVTQQEDDQLFVPRAVSLKQLDLVPETFKKIEQFMQDCKKHDQGARSFGLYGDADESIKDHVLHAITHGVGLRCVIANRMYTLSSDAAVDWESFKKAKEIAVKCGGAIFVVHVNLNRLDKFELSQKFNQDQIVESIQSLRRKCEEHYRLTGAPIIMCVVGDTSLPDKLVDQTIEISRVTDAQLASAELT